MTAPEEPPGFYVRTEARKAAADNGFRIEAAVEPGGWMAFTSTTAGGTVWIAGSQEAGHWYLSLDHRGVAAELVDLPPSPFAGPGIATFAFDGVSALHAAMDRAYRLGASLPDAPLHRFAEQIAALSRSTEAERLVVRRVGQDVFRGALMDYWGGRCAVTGLAVPALLRASHIKPWADCESDAERLDVFNGLLLAAHLDAAFDAGLITVTDDGALSSSPMLPAEACDLLGLDRQLKVSRLHQRHRHYLAWHRREVFVATGTR